MSLVKPTTIEEMRLVPDAAVAELASCGYRPEEVVAALQGCGGDPEAAYLKLYSRLTGGDLPKLSATFWRANGEEEGVGGFLMCWQS